MEREVSYITITKQEYVCLLASNTAKDEIILHLELRRVCWKTLKYLKTKNKTPFFAIFNAYKYKNYPKKLAPKPQYLSSNQLTIEGLRHHSKNISKPIADGLY